MENEIAFIGATAYAHANGSVDHVATPTEDAVQLQWYDMGYHIIDDPEDLPDWFWASFRVTSDGVVERAKQLQRKKR